MKIFLVDNLVMPEEGSLATMDIHPHLGLLALAAAAEPGGHRVRIFDPKRALRWGELSYDPTIYERVAAEILSDRPDMVGFTTLGCSFLFAIRVGAILKRHEQDLPILLGGPHATMLHREILERFPQFDVVVRHEADEIFPDVLDRLEHRDFGKIPGVSWREGDGSGRLRFNEGRPMVKDLDTLPITSYDYYPVADLGLDLLRIEAGRGCPFHCSFCSTASFFQRNFRLKTAGRMVRELDILHERYGYSDFKLDHDLFTVNRRKVIEFCEAAAGRGYRWRASARVDCVDEELLEIMAGAGCVSLYCGIETGSERMQGICQKRLDLGRVEPILRVANGLGIEITTSFITGYPEEQEKDQDDTLDMLGDCLRFKCIPQLHMLAPEPGTPLFDEMGKTVRYDGYSGRYNAMLIGPGDEQLILDHPDIFQTYYYYPARMPRDRHIFAVEAVDLIRRGGPDVVNYLLRAYGGRLSKLIGDLHRFAESRGSWERPEREMIEVYLGWKFGVHHHLTSLYRYALRANVAPSDPGGPDPERIPIFELGRRYRLNPGLQFLAGLHDCGDLLRQIRESKGPGLLDDSETGELGVYLLDASVGEPKNYRINPGIEAILGLFEQPRRCSDVEELIAGASGSTDFDSGFFENLVRKKILLPDASAGAPREDAAEVLCHEPTET